MINLATVPTVKPDDHTYIMTDNDCRIKLTDISTGGGGGLPVDPEPVEPSEDVTILTADGKSIGMTALLEFLDKRYLEVV